MKSVLLLSQLIRKYIWRYTLLLILAWPYGAVQSKELTWQPLKGTASDISINQAGIAYLLSSDGRPMRWDGEQQRWRYLTGNFRTIAAAEGSFPWAINADDELFRYNGLWWEKKHKAVSTVAANAKGQVYIITNNGKIKHWYRPRNEWQSLPGMASQIAVDSEGKPWVIIDQNHLASFDGKKWRTHSKIAASRLVLGNPNALMIVDLQGKLQQWNQRSRSWEPLAGLENIKEIAVSPTRELWALDNKSRMFATGELFKKKLERKAKKLKAPSYQLSINRATKATAPGVIANELNAPALSVPTVGKGKKTDITTENTPFSGPAVNPETVTTRAELTFENTRQNATRLAIGSDGSVFGLLSGGNIVRWSNQRESFQPFPGSLSRIAVDPEGNPWGVSSLGRVFRHTGQKWQQIVNVTAMDIAIGFDGTVIIVDRLGNLARFDNGSNTFRAIQGRAAKAVAVSPNGAPWIIRTDKVVLDCGVSPCKVFPQTAQSISIGPDGSVFIISSANQLMRLDTLRDRFEVIPVNGFGALDNVAVGPQGFPWLATQQTKTLASRFFERDESQDFLIAAQTPPNGTIGVGPTLTVNNTELSGFTFSKNIKFSSVKSTLPIGTGDKSLIEVGNDGSIWAVESDVPPVVYEKFNVNKNRFEPVNFFFSNNPGNLAFKFDIASNGDFWGVTGSELYRIRSTQAKVFPIVGGVGFPSDVSVGGDDTIYVVDSSTLYSMPKTSNRFRVFSKVTDVLSVAGASGSDVWIIDTANQVRQWTGSKFEARPKGKIQTADFIKASNGGDIYIIDNKIPYKWNGLNNSFDKINNLSIEIDEDIAIEADGRVWVTSETDTTVKRARD